MASTGTPDERFDCRVDRSGGADACHLWLGYRCSTGYGTFSLCRGSTLYAHRYAWSRVNGPVPEKRYICHRCDEPACVNVAHLFIASHKGNMMDCARKGRTILKGYKQRYRRGDDPADRSGGPDACHTWRGSLSADGYGHSRGIAAHRRAWMDAHGAVPVGLCVLHRCDVRACVNIKHLFLGTRKENAIDMTRKGRNAFQRPGLFAGENSPCAKLSDEAVREIRASPLSAAKIAPLYGVAAVTIVQTRSGRNWKHVV